MSRTLNLAEGLLSQGRTHQGLGRVRDALSILSRLARLRELPPGVVEETQARLGEIQLQRKKFTRARRHLLIALRYDADNAHYHQMLGRTLSESEEHWERAARHYRRAIELNPDECSALTDLGLLCVKMGKADEGVTHLKNAVEKRPADPAVLAKLVKGLRWSGRVEEAKEELRTALFRNGRDRRFRQLWDDLQFQLLRRRQLRDRKKTQHPESHGPVLLPMHTSASEKSVAARPMTENAFSTPLRLMWGMTGLPQQNVQ